MNAIQFYEQVIKPLSSKEKGFDTLKKILPHIERISLTDEDLNKVKLNGPLHG